MLTSVSGSLHHPSAVGVLICLRSWQYYRNVKSLEAFLAFGRFGVVPGLPVGCVGITSGTAITRDITLYQECPCLKTSYNVHETKP